MAADKQRHILLVSAIEMSDGFSLDRLRSPGCQYFNLPEIGKDATLSFACKGGNPNASVSFAANGLAITLTWVSAGVEPGNAEKAALVELAKFAATSQTVH